MENLKKRIEVITETIDAIKNTLPISSNLYTKLLSDIVKDFKNYLDENCEKINDDCENEKKENENKYKIPEECFTSISRYGERLNRLTVSVRIVPQSYIIMLICQYDVFIGDLIRFVLNEKPEILTSSERQMTFKELNDFESIKEAVDYLIEKEIDSVIRCTHDDHIKWFEKKLNINLRSDGDLLKKFWEITERRNVLTHCNGKVNDSYLKKCKNYDIELDEDIKVGAELKVTPEYFANACDVIFEISIKLSHIIWNKIKPSKIIKESINSIAYKLIQDENYDLAIKILDFGINNFKNIQSMAIDMTLLINLAQCYLWKNEETKVKEIINNIDWSACKKQFIIAKNVLERNFNYAIELLENIGDDNIICKTDLIEWPLFKELREQKEFKKLFRKKYGEEVLIETKKNIDTELVISTMI